MSKRSKFLFHKEHMNLYMSVTWDIQHWLFGIDFDSDMLKISLGPVYIVFIREEDT